MIQSDFFSDIIDSEDEDDCHVTCGCNAETCVVVPGESYNDSYDGLSVGLCLDCYVQKYYYELKKLYGEGIVFMKHNVFFYDDGKTLDIRWRIGHNDDPKEVKRMIMEWDGTIDKRVRLK